MTWATVPIGTVIRSSQYGLSLPSDPEGLLPIVGMKDIQDGRVRIDPTVCINMSEEDATDYLLADGDILLNRTNSPDLVGKTGIYRGDGKAVFASYLVRLVLDRERVDPDYVIQILASEGGQRHIKQLATRAVSQANLNPTTFKNHFYIPLPQLGEQIAIRGVLLAWDTAIEKTERLIAAKQKRSESLSNRLLFGHSRLRQRNTEDTRALHWFSAPSDWQLVEIGKVAREVSALNGSDDGLPVLSCTKYDGLVDSLEYFDKQVFSHDTSKYKVVGRGQFAYATNHVEEGSIGYQDFVDAGLVSPIYTVFQSDPKKIADGYFYKLLKTEKLRQIFSARTNSSVDRRGSLRWKDFARIHIPLPPLDEQHEINAVLDDAKREIVLLQTEVKALKQQKRGLMQKLLTGQWRVTVPANKEAHHA
ncbi:MAG: restriction endonuclease subunit S [Betaproteobacteria bacterium]|nr:restriction endonuclease subunit S [Betaproteobacteria bacterium]